MIRINLAPSTERRRRFRLRMPSLNLGLAFGVVYLVAVVGVAGYWWMLSREEAKLTAEIDRATKELTALKATIGQGAKIKDQVGELRKRIQVVEDLTKGQTRAVILLDAFADMVPQNLWITGLEERGAILRVTGSAYSPTAVAEFMAKLRASKTFKDVDIVVSRQDLVKTPSLVTFEVTCRFEA